jgi:hypothetical protein
MYPIRLEWKAFNVDLAAVEAWMRANAGGFYAGNSADSHLTLWFTEDPGAEVIADVTDYWDGITEESDEADYVSFDAIKAAVETLKAGLLAKTWDQMSTAERKLVLGQMPTRAELGL